DLDHRRQVEMLDRRPDRAGRLDNRRLFPRLRIGLIKLPYLAVSTPTGIAVTSLAQICMGDDLEAACGVESSRKLVGNGLIVNDPVRPRRTDCLLVEPLGIELTAFDPCDLRADQRGAVFEILRAILCPDLEPPMVRGQSLEMLLSSVRSCGV